MGNEAQVTVIRHKWSQSERQRHETKTGRENKNGTINGNLSIKENEGTTKRQKTDTETCNTGVKASESTREMKERIATNQSLALFFRLVLVVAYSTERWD